MPYVTKSNLPPGVGRPESRLIAEYVANKFPDRRIALSFPLGPEVTIGDQRLT